MTPLHITLELMSHQTDRESTHHRIWWRDFVNGHPDQHGHYYIATTNLLKDPSEKDWRYLPEELHRVLIPGYLENMRKYPHWARGNVGWIEAPSTHTFGILSRNDSLPFQDSTVTRIVRYNTMPHVSGHDQQEDEMLLSELREAHRVLKPGKKIEFHETRAAEGEASLSFDKLRRLVESFNSKLRAELAAKGVPEAQTAGFDTANIKARAYFESMTTTNQQGSLEVRVKKHSLTITKLS